MYIYDYITYTYPDKAKLGYNTDSYKKFMLYAEPIVKERNSNPKKIAAFNKEQEKLKAKRLAKLEKYNVKNGIVNPLSILKTYNNQDGEFEAIDQYPGQLGADGALYKWFKYKFLPGGKNANRPSLYIDGDESFTKTGIEYIIGNEVSMKRNKDWAFYEKFNGD